MFLKEITLVNFKCHEKLYLNFENLNKSASPNNGKKNTLRKTTFLLGENGTGKSALLKAIALVTAGSSALGNLLGETDDWIKNGQKNCEISATLITAKGEERKISLQIEKGFQLRDIVEKNSKSLELIDDAINHADRNYFVVAYGASRRLNRDSQMSRNSSDFSLPRAQNIQSLFNPDSTLVSLSNWAIDLDYSGEGDGLETVKTALDAFLVDNVKFKSIDKKKKQLIFSTPDGNIPLNQLSDGYQNVAAWVGDLMYRINENFKNFNDPLSARGLLLIDEIDLHLHPKWQRQLHTFLKTKLPNFQIIATTHSPLTAQQAEEHELYALRRAGKSVELIPFIGKPNEMLLHQILMSPVFGLETDESVVVETAKAAVREQVLKNGGKKSSQKILRGEVESVANTPINIRTNSLFSSEDFELLKTINEELKSK
jgi:predicted ATP-binding protein involved in virulence